MTSVSRIPHPRRFDETASLSRAQVIAAALDFVDAYGLAALSVRGLAKELGVYPTTLHWHAGSKSQLIALLHQSVLESMDLAPVDEVGWKDWIRRFAAEARHALAPHPELSGAFLSQLPISPLSLTFADRLLQVLRTAGFKGAALTNAYNSVLACVFGWLAQEFAADPGESDEEWQEEFSRILTDAPDDQYPAINAERATLANQAWLLRWVTGPGAPLPEGFAFMLEVVLDGLETRISS